VKRIKTADVYFAVFRQLLRFLFACFFVKYEIEGEENLLSLIKDNKGALLASNHISNLDPVLYMLVRAANIRFLAKNSLFRVPVLGWCMRKCGQLSVNRAAPDAKAIRTALERIKNGQILCIFPEGTRSADGNLREGKPGSAMIAFKSNAIVVPAAIWGSHKILPKNKFVPRVSRVKIKIGAPIYFDGYYSKEPQSADDERKIYKLMTDKIMDEIRKLYESIR